MINGNEQFFNEPGDILNSFKKINSYYYYYLEKEHVVTNSYHGST